MFEQCLAAQLDILSNYSKASQRGCTVNYVSRVKVLTGNAVCVCLCADEGAALSGLQRRVAVRGSPAAEWRRGEGGLVSASTPSPGALPPTYLDQKPRAAD